MHIREFSKLAKAKIYIQKSNEILYNNNNQVEKIIGKDPIHNTKIFKLAGNFGITDELYEKNL